jgi:hypothetical protein
LKEETTSTKKKDILGREDRIKRSQRDDNICGNFWKWTERVKKIQEMK